MSEQQQLHNPSYIPAVPNRQPMANFMPMQYFAPGPRLDNIGIHHGAAGHPLYLCSRPQDPTQPMYRPIQQFLLTVPPVMPESQLLVNHEEYTNLPMHAPQYQAHAPYPHTMQGVSPMPANVPQVQRYPAEPKTPAARPERRVLVVSDPKTKRVIDLGSPESGPQEDAPATSTPAEVNITEKVPMSTDPETPKAKEDQPCEPPIPVAVADNDVPIADPSAQTCNVLQDKENVEAVVENGLATVEDDDKLDLERSDTETAGESDGDGNDTDTFSRRTYSREFMLACKESPPKELPQFSMDFIYRSGPRMQRSSHRAQRVIRLPVGASVKRIEDAFVPSQLRKKDPDAAGDPKKALSQELSLILNKLSASNLLETANDIKNLKISSLEDVNTLANLTFQKAIRQAKYSQLFAQLCKELKGYTVGGSEPFELLVMRQVQELFNTPLDTVLSELSTVIDTRIAEAKDDDIKKLLEDDRKTLIAKKTDSYYGNISLLAELYRCHLVTSKTMNDCLRKLKDSQTPEALSSLILLLQTCGAELDQQAKNAVEQCFTRLRSLAKPGKLPSHQIFKIEELIELRNRGWKKPANPQQTMPPPNSDIRKPEEKPRWSSTASLDTKRKSIKQTNPVTPSNLAVNQQPYNQPVLKPPGNWSQGSGHLRSSANGSSMQSYANKPTYTLLQNRFRELSPVVAQKSHSAVSLSALDEKTADTPPVSEQIEDLATFVIATLSSAEDDPVLPFTKCRAHDRPTLARAVLDRVVERKSDERNSAGRMFFQLLQKNIMTPDNLVFTCAQYLPTCDDDWLQDVPSGLRYLAEIFQHLIQSEDDYLSTLVQLLKPLQPPKNAAIVLAHCLNLAASRLGTECVASKFRALRLCWTRLGVPKDSVSSFVKSYGVQFTVDSDDFDSALQALSAHSKSSEYVLDLFRRLSVAPVPPNFVRSCTSTLVTHSTDLPRTGIDDHVVSLGILVDHNPDRELEVLRGLQDCSSAAPTDQWLKSLLDKKVISSEAFDTWNKSTKGGLPITKDLPLRNP